MSLARCWHLSSAYSFAGRTDPGKRLQFGQQNQEMTNEVSSPSDGL